MKNYAHTKIIAIIIALCIATVAAAEPRISSWYEVEDWELEYCSKWGGTETAQRGAVVSGDVYLAETTLTLLAEKTAYNAYGVEQYLYKINWYLEPIGEALYWVELFNGESIRLAEGVASYNSPAVGSYVQYNTKRFDWARIIFKTDSEKSVTVPVINMQ